MKNYIGNVKDECEKLLHDEIYIKNILNKINFYSNLEAVQILEVFLEFAKENKLNYVYGWVTLTLGRLYLEDGKYCESDNLFNESLNIFKSNDNTEGILTILNLFIASRSIQQKYEEAIEYLIKGIDICNQTNNMSKMLIFKANMSSMYSEIGEYRKSLEVLDEMKDILWNRNDRNKVLCYINKASNKIKLNRLDEASEDLDFIKDTIDSMPMLKMNWMIQKAEIYIKSQHFKQAEKLLNGVIKFCRENKVYSFVYTATVSLSSIKLAENKHNEVIYMLKDIENKIDTSDDAKRYYYNLSIAYKKINDYKNAYNCLEKYSEIENKLENIRLSSAVKKLNKKKEEMEIHNYRVLYEQNKLVYSAGQRIISNINKKHIFEFIADELSKVISYDAMGIVVFNDDTGNYEYRLIVENEKKCSITNINVFEDSLAGYCIKNKKTIVIGNVAEEYPEYISDINEYRKKIAECFKRSISEYIGSTVLAPMIIKDKVNGVLLVQRGKEQGFNFRDVTTLNTFASYIAIALENDMLYKKSQYNAGHDHLTGLFNRRKLICEAEKVFSLAGKDEECFSIAIVDVDKFKFINDNYGHIIGDKVLAGIAEIIKKSIGHDDIVGRYGGDEFIIILRNCNCKDNHNKCTLEKIRRSIELMDVKDNKGNNIKIQVSIGGVKLKNKSTNLEDYIILADKYLYEAKRTGRNKVVCFIKS